MSQNRKGLTGAQAAARLAQVRENRLAGRGGPGVAALFFSQFKDVMILILAAATLVSAWMGQGAEAVAILAVMLLNGVMGFVQEYRTEKTLEALARLNAPTARVRRDGREQKIAAAQVVPGDVLLVQAGDRVAADCRLDACVGAACDESMLTGESVPVHKGPGEMLYMGCILTAGRCEGVVTATGMATEMGKIAHLVDGAREGPTPLQRQLRQLGRYVAAVCLAVCLAVALLGVWQGGDVWQMLLTGVSLAVAAVPEGLPAIVTVTLALSVGRILRRGAVIRRLHAVEALGCAGVICTDKTGTVTQNQMTVRRIRLPEGLCTVTGDGCAAGGCIRENGQAVKNGGSPGLARLLRAAALCATAQISPRGEGYRVSGDPTETALLVAAARGGVLRGELLRTWRILDEQPFDPAGKTMSVTAAPAGGGTPLVLCKGAPEAVLARCTRLAQGAGARPLTEADRARLLGQARAMAGEALRVLAFAEGAGTGGSGGLCWLGLAGMMDPPRPEVAPAVARCRGAGIKPVMITGDSPETALAVAREVGIAAAGDGLLTGPQLDAMDDAALRRACRNTAVYARVTPAHKLRIVRAYKAAGQVTAMTGDGVNDAPAVKEADIGVAMGLAGTDVTKQAAGVVVLDDNFATIVAAVEEGRAIYANIRRFIRYLLGCNLGEVLGMFFAMALGLPVPLLPIQLLLVNLFTDGLPAVALGLEPADADAMARPPRPKGEGLFARGLGAAIAFRGLLLGLASCGAYWFSLARWGDVTAARTVCFAVVVLAQLVHLFECRSAPLRANPLLAAAAAGSAVLTFACIYLPWTGGLFATAPLSGAQLLCAAAATAACPLLAALARWAVRHSRGRR